MMEAVESDRSESMNLIQEESYVQPSLSLYKSSYLTDKDFYKEISHSQEIVHGTVNNSQELFKDNQLSGTLPLDGSSKAFMDGPQLDLFDDGMQYDEELCKGQEILLSSEKDSKHCESENGVKLRLSKGLDFVFRIKENWSDNELPIPAILPDKSVNSDGLDNIKRVTIKKKKIKLTMLPIFVIFMKSNINSMSAGFVPFDPQNSIIGFKGIVERNMNNLLTFSLNNNITVQSPVTLASKILGQIYQFAYSFEWYESKYLIPLSGKTGDYDSIIKVCGTKFASDGNPYNESKGFEKIIHTNKTCGPEETDTQTTSALVEQKEKQALKGENTPILKRNLKESLEGQKLLLSEKQNYKVTDRRLSFPFNNFSMDDRKRKRQRVEIKELDILSEGSTNKNQPWTTLIVLCFLLALILVDGNGFMGFCIILRIFATNCQHWRKPSIQDRSVSGSQRTEIIYRRKQGSCGVEALEGTNAWIDRAGTFNRSFRSDNDNIISLNEHRKYPPTIDLSQEGPRKREKPLPLRHGKPGKKPPNETQENQKAVEEYNLFKKKLRCVVEGCKRQREIISVPCGCHYFCEICYKAALDAKQGLCPSCGRKLDNTFKKRE